MNEVFKALGDPTRRKILDLLKKKDLTAGEIVESFNITGASISHHLEILRKSNLISSEKQGQFIVYSINTRELEELIKWAYTLSGKKKTKK